MKEETISAISTAIGESAIGIVRMSGERSIEIADVIFQAINKKSLKNTASRTVVYGKILDSHENIIDECIAFVMRAPNSYTKENIVEFHCHGSLAALEKVLLRTLEAGARLAERGEFTKRAFLNGRLDLSQAEAVLDIIQAKTTEALQVAENKLAGETSSKFYKVKQEILNILAHIEALIDFPEDDIEELEINKIEDKIDKLIDEVDELLINEGKGKILREGIETAIIGKPNVGKSSLLNYLSKKEKSIVTEIPGTTRDVIEEYINIEGVPLKIIDTAGIHKTEDKIEKIGIERSKEKAGKASLILALFDGSREFDEEDEEILIFINEKNCIVLITKSDLPLLIDEHKLQKFDPIKISVKNDTGIEELNSYISKKIENMSSEPKFIKSARELEILNQLKNNFINAKNAVELNTEIDLISIDLRSALEKINELTGESVSEDVVNEIFSKFCVGK